MAIRASTKTATLWSIILVTSRLDNHLLGLNSTGLCAGLKLYTSPRSTKQGGNDPCWWIHSFRFNHAKAIIQQEHKPNQGLHASKFSTVYIPGRLCLHCLKSHSGRSGRRERRRFGATDAAARTLTLPTRASCMQQGKSPRNYIMHPSNSVFTFQPYRFCKVTCIEQLYTLAHLLAWMD